MKAAQTRTWLHARSISAIVNVTADLPNFFDREGVMYHAIRCEDSEEAVAVEALEKALNCTLEQMETWLAAGHSVLVHCHAGRSRSATVVLSHLARQMPLAEALDLVSSRRSVLPNRGFYSMLVRRQAESYRKAVDAARPWHVELLELTLKTLGCHAGGAPPIVKHRHESSDAPAVPPTPEYDTLIRAFVSALEASAAAAAKRGGRAGMSLAERLARQEQSTALMHRTGVVSQPPECRRPHVRSR